MTDAKKMSEKLIKQLIKAKLIIVNFVSVVFQVRTQRPEHIFLLLHQLVEIFLLEFGLGLVYQIFVVFLPELL